MKTNLFFGCKTSDEVKQRYDELSHVFKPQANGETNEMMNSIKDEYDKLIMVLGESKTVGAVESKSPLSDKLKELMEKVDTSELGTEVLGSWLWVTKKTFPIKDVLKSLGFRYSANKMAWYYRSDENRSGNQDPISLDLIRAKYGTVVAR